MSSGGGLKQSEHMWLQRDALSIITNNIHHCYRWQALGVKQETSLFRISRPQTGHWIHKGSRCPSIPQLPCSCHPNKMHKCHGEYFRRAGLFQKWFQIPQLLSKNRILFFFCLVFQTEECEQFKNLAITSFENQDLLPQTVLCC